MTQNKLLTAFCIKTNLCACRPSGNGSIQFLLRPTGTELLSSRCACFSSRRSFCSALCIIADCASDPSGFYITYCNNVACPICSNIFIFYCVNKTMDCHEVRFPRRLNMPVSESNQNCSMLLKVPYNWKSGPSVTKCMTLYSSSCFTCIWFASICNSESMEHDYSTT